MPVRFISHHPNLLVGMISAFSVYTGSARLELH